MNDFLTSLFIIGGMVAVMGLLKAFQLKAEKPEHWIKERFQDSKKQNQFNNYKKQNQK